MTLSKYLVFKDDHRDITVQTKTALVYYIF